MKRITTCVLLGIGALCPMVASAQYAPSFSQQIFVTENSGNDQTDFQARLVIDTETEILAGNMQSDGSDIRFLVSGPCDTVNYAHWIESGINTTTTVLWVKIPSLLANSTDTITMYYGDSTATDLSNFSLTFPSAVITAGSNVTLGGTNNVGWLQVDAGDTLFVTAGTIFDVQARYAQIDGVIYGLGAGYASPGMGVFVGNGPGGGFSGTSSGAGGGSYGGIGGSGGYDSGDPINTGGVSYGTSSALDLDMGSTGGSTSTVAAGNGGGAFILTSEFVNISGEINMNGGEAQQPGGGQGAGGGSGGGVLVLADNLDVTGTISVDGGGGSIGTSTANDDGGGGSGGRIKLFYDNMFNLAASYSMDGGLGGPNGSASGGLVGEMGTSYEGINPFMEATYAYQTVSQVISTPTPVVATLSDENGLCSVTPPVPEALDMCGSILLGTPDVVFPITTIGTTTVTWTYVDGFGGMVTQQQNVVISGVDVSVSQVGTQLTANGVGMQYQWVDCDSNFAFIQGATSNTFTPSITGNYAVIVSDSICSDTSACYLVDYTGVQEQQLNNLKIYPNPSTTGIFNVQVDETIVKLELIDLTGRVIAVQEQPSKGVVDASTLMNGNYVLRVTTMNGVASKAISILK